MIDDLELLATYGPDAPGPTDLALRSARTRLLAGMGHREPAAGSRTRSWFPLAAGGLTVAAAAVAAAVLVAFLGPAGESPAPANDIRLVATTAPEFGYEIPGLGDPVFTADPGGPIIAVYQVHTQDSVNLRAGAGDTGGTPGEHPAEVNGRPGRILSLPADGPGTVASTQLTWERAPGVWLTINTTGRRATEAEAVRLAGTVREKRQPLGFEATLGLIPQGWTLGGFKDSFLLQYRDPHHPDQEVDLQWWADPADVGTGETAGLEKRTAVTVGGRPATLDRAAEIWVVNGGRLPDGSAFRLMAPRSFTADQVLRMAGSVRRTK
jgi:hypothetical protein